MRSIASGQRNKMLSFLRNATFSGRYLGELIRFWFMETYFWHSFVFWPETVCHSVSYKNISVFTQFFVDHFKKNKNYIINWIDLFQAENIYDHTFKNSLCLVFSESELKILSLWRCVCFYRSEINVFFFLCQRLI